MHESNQDYKLRAFNFHSCGLELAEIYNKVRTFKTLDGENSPYCQAENRYMKTPSQMYLQNQIKIRTYKNKKQ